MIQLMGENYYFDLDVINDYINIESKQVVTGDTDQHISVVKYEMVKMMMEIVVTEQEETDEMLGHKLGEFIPTRSKFFYKKTKKK